MPILWITVVAEPCQTETKELTLRQFWHTIARRGGWIAGKSDGRPGWKTIWRGWFDVSRMVEGVELYLEN